jgi:hypothetical protein
VANTQVQFGFQPYGITAGRTPNFALRRRTIAYNYATSLFRGDPVASGSGGTIVAVSSQSAPVGGIFWGCEYTAAGPLTALPVKSKYWPGSSANAYTNSTVTAFIIDDPEELFLVASLGSTAAIAIANIMDNIQWAAGAGGNTATGVSSYVIDDGNINTTSTLPFKIMDLYSTYAPPGVNGADNTTVYNWAVVKMNNTDRAAGTTGI